MIHDRLEADVQNDASDKRKVILPSGKEVITTCYVRGEYDVLAVPLFPFTGTWEFAYKWNVKCRRSAFKGYSKEDQDQLLATIEKIVWPLDTNWTSDLIALLDVGAPKFEPNAEVERTHMIERLESDQR